MRDYRCHVCGWMLARRALLVVPPMLFTSAARCDAPADQDAPAAGTTVSVTVNIDQTADVHPISPLIYGASFATGDQARLLRLTLNRSGGNATTRYNWRQNATSSGSDWFFLSHPEGTGGPAASVDAFVQANRAAGAVSMVTVPIIGWSAKLKPDGGRTWSFSVAKYGPQQKTEQYEHDMGNGVRPDGTPITGNDPNDANVRVGTEYQRGMVQHLTAKFGTAAHSGPRYYLLDNEPGIWQGTHRDVFPIGVTMDDLFAKERDAARMVKSVDPSALVAGPEEWGWTNYFASGYDSQWAGKHGWSLPKPDKTAHGNVDMMPWLLSKFAAEEKQSGKRLLDVFTLHYYPQGGPGDENSDAAQTWRNRSTRSLWDPNYHDTSWINDNVRLIPRMKEWVRNNYPGTKIGITEYSWGDDGKIGGAIAEADVLGILGRENVDLAARWACPGTGTPTFKAMQMYRNADGKGAGFGDVSVRCQVPNPDSLSAFAARDSHTGALTVMLVNKLTHNDASVTVHVARPVGVSTVTRYTLAADNNITRTSEDLRGTSGVVSLPAGSITLLVYSKPG